MGKRNIKKSNPALLKKEEILEPIIEGRKNLEDTLEDKIEPNLLSFTVYQNLETKENPRIFYFDIKGKTPIKLGDGTYGAVFQVRDKISDKVEGKFAVKIFYQEEELISQMTEGYQEKRESELRIRFFHELGFMEEIYSCAEEKGIPSSKLVGVAPPLYGTEEFQDSPAFKTLFAKDQNDFYFSSRAIVMNRYQGTLKDILETRKRENIHEPVVVEQQKNENLNKLTGYEVLKKISPKERIRWVWPILEKIIDGLYTLYIGGFAHLDLKPANIFYRTQGDKDYELVIADMGYLFTKDHPFVHIDDNSAHPLDVYRRRPMLGTLHYRSPEQKDDHDICDAEVRKSENDTFILTIRDPKFNDSIIEEGDLVYFSGKNKKTPFSIIRVEEGVDEGGLSVKRIIVDSFGEPVKNDSKTQVIMRKRQQVRTDLFGLGAIAYDLITCGDSPERFYERLRMLDTPDFSVTKILDMYERVESFNTNEPIAQHIFNSFEDNGRYPDSKFVEFILKCMLYNATDTFYDKYHKGNVNIFEKLKTDFVPEFDENLKRENVENSQSGSSKNIIIFQEDIKKNGTEYGPVRLNYILAEIQEWGHSRFADRLVLGFLYLKQIFNYFNKEVFRDKIRFFAELYPSNIVKTGKDDFIRCHHIVFQSFKDYEESLKGDELYIKLYRDRDDFFVPDYIANIRKPIWITKAKEVVDETGDQKNGSLEEFEFEYFNTSRSFSYDKIKKGDWIVMTLKEKPAIAFRIEYVNQEKMRLSSTQPEDFKDLKYGATKLVYYKDIDRLKYYLHMLGMYIYQLFFFERGSSNNDLLSFVDQINIDQFQNPDLKNRCVDLEEIMDSFFSKKNTNIPFWEKFIFKIMTSLVVFYSKLTFHEMEGSFYEDLSRIVDDSDRDKRLRGILSKIEGEIGSIQKNIAYCIGFTTEDLGHFKLPLPEEMKETEKISSEIREDLQKYYPLNFDFIDVLKRTIIGEF